MFDEDGILRIRQSCDCEGGGGDEWRKLRSKKIEDYEIGQLLFDFYRHLAKPDDEADWPRLTR